MVVARMLMMAALPIAAAGWMMPATADTADALCEVRKDGETKQGRSGPCDFSQRQGYVRMDLRNGETWDLTPTNGANEFRDQHGNKVKRSFEGDTHVYKWPHKKILVTFGRAGHSAAAGVPPMPYSTNEYRATAYFRCSLGSPTHDQSCPGGIHRGDPGSASIRIKRPDGRERVLNFARGDVTTPDGGRLTWGKDGDEWYIGIDNREFYIVPEAAIYGD
jgi:hypothetical protein